MSRSADKAARRVELIEAAARLIASEGAAGLTLRRVAEDVGTSTMAIYTHFGGMPELRHAVRNEGFSRLAAHLAKVDESTDAVADLAMLGLAYYANATANPDLYRVMFMEQTLDAADAEIGWETFEVLVSGVRRCIAAGRFADANPADLATQLWAFDHGLVSLELAHLLTSEQALNALGAGARNLFVAYGDDHERARRSQSAALKRSRLSSPSRKAEAR